MTIRAVIWDFGGVILRMVDETPRQRLAERLGVNLQTLYRLIFDSESAQRCALGEISIEQHWATLGRILKVSPGDLAAVIDQFWAADDIDQELSDYIASLRPAYTLGLLSNACSDLRGLLTTRWKIAPIFDDLVISAEIGLVKPDPRIYHLALERLKVTAVETVFFDDNPENIQAARRVGLHAFVFTRPEQARRDLAAAVEAQGGVRFWPGIFYEADI